MCVKIDGTVKNLLFLVSDFREIVLSNFSTSKIVIIGTVIWGIFQDDKLYFNLHLSLQITIPCKLGSLDQSLRIFLGTIVFDIEGVILS